MIFCTVGTQLPFDRLVGYLLQWSHSSNHKDIIFQVGNSEKFTSKDGYNSKIQEPNFSSFFDRAEIIVSHAGMGNIIRALDLNKAIVIVPRKSSLGEHINDHQLDTAESFSGLPNIFIANDYEEFCLSIERAKEYTPQNHAGNFRLQQLIAAVSDFVTN